MKLVLDRQNPTFSVAAVQLRADITYSKATVSVVIDERGLNKYARDYVNEVDQLTVAFGKGLLTSQLVIDRISNILLTKAVLPDDLVAEDTLSMSIGYIRAFSSGSGTGDALTSFEIIKRLSDSVLAVEQIVSRSMGKPLQDTQGVIDSADIEYLDEKLTSDTGLTNDLLASIGVEKLLTDAAAAVSSGSLRMTDYVDITYLAEDYVGTSKTFS